MPVTNSVCELFRAPVHTDSVGHKQNVQTVWDHTAHLVRTVLHTDKDMRCLQANVQSLNTSKLLLEMAIQRHQPDVLLLQEVWQPKEKDCIKDFVVAAIKTRRQMWWWCGDLYT